MKDSFKALAAALSVGLLILGTATYASPNIPLVQDDPADYTPNLLGTWKDGGNYRTVLDLEESGGYIYAGGQIDKVSRADGTPYATTFGNLIRFNAGSGEVDESFHPQLLGNAGDIAGGQVNGLAISPDGKALFVAGLFKTVDGVRQKGLIKWDLENNRLDPTFNAQIGADGGSGVVYDLKFAPNGDLLVGSSSTSVGGSTQAYLTSLNPVTGQATKYCQITISDPVAAGSGAVRVFKIALNPAGTKAMILGNFRKVNGQERLQLAMLDLGNGAVGLSKWYARDALRKTSPPEGAESWKKMYCPAQNPACLRDVDFSPDGSWIVVGSSGGPGAKYPGIKDSIVRFEVNDKVNNQPTWINYTGGDSVYSVRATSNYVYSGGHHKYLNAEVWLGGVKQDVLKEEHYGLGAIDAHTGRALSDWNPGHDTSRGEGWRAMLADPQTGLWVGGDTDLIMGETHARVGLFPLQPL